MENQFNVGDLVWAKASRYPWWPSIIYDEALTSTEVRQAKKEGCVLVSFFGDNSYKWLDPKKLLDFESNYSMCSNRSRSCLFVKAINEAVYEVKHRAALGMTCPCVFFASYRPSSVEGFSEVDLAGYQSGGVYTVQQIKRFRQEFQPVETLSFVQQLALDPTNVPHDLNSSKEVARVLAYRKARYAEVDEPYFLAFGVTPIRPGDPIVASNNQEISLFQDPSEAETSGQEKPKVKRQKENKKRVAHLKDKVHVAKAKGTVKIYQRRDSNAKRSKDLVPRKKRQANFTSVSDDEKQSSPSLFKEPSISKDRKGAKSLCATSKCDDVRFIEEVQSSDTSVPSKTELTQKDSPAPANKRQRSEVRETATASSPQKKRMKGENTTIAKEPEEGPKTILSMKFPPDISLPSPSELKAKFARFGPLDTAGVRASRSKSRCQVVFMNKSDAENAYSHAISSQKMFGQTKVDYKLRTQVSTPELLESGTSGASAGSNLRREETLVTIPRDSVTSRGASVCRIQCLSEEIHARYWQQKGEKTGVKVNQGSVDISEKMLYLLNECSRIVLESKGS